MPIDMVFPGISMGVFQAPELALKSGIDGHSQPEPPEASQRGRNV
jgi:hypothetical protein